MCVHCQFTWGSVLARNKWLVKSRSICLCKQRTICSRWNFFYYSKSWNTKRYRFAIVKNVCHLMWKIFLPFGYPPAMFISYLRWKLRDKNCLMKFKRQNLFTLNGKNFSNLQMNIFCPFKFCHNRKNGFRWDVATWATKFWYWTLCLLLWNCHLHP